MSGSSDPVYLNTPHETAANVEAARNTLDGVLLIDKEPGCTSHDVVAKARRILGLRAIGHAGTLDPLASGLLVLLLGEGTKISDYLLENDKAYECKIRLGVSTSTQDISGEIVEEKSVSFTDEELRAAIVALTGDVELPVPMHSAVRVDGKKLYEYARKDQEVEAPLRQMRFYDIELLDAAVDGRGHFLRVRLACSKGSFIRSWAHELGKHLQCGGCVEELRRLKSAPFSVEKAISLDQLEEKWRNRERRHGAELGSAWVPLSQSLPTLPRIWVEGRDETLLRNGQVPNSVKSELLRHISPHANGGHFAPPIRALSRDSEELVAILAAEPGQFYKIRRVFLRH